MRLRGGERVLVRIPSWLGDAVMAEPVLRALRPWCGAGERAGSVTLAGPALLLALFESTLPGARLAPIEPRAALPDWRGHDLALLLTGSFRSAWTAFRAGIPERVGWRRDGRGLLLTLGAAPARERGRTPLGLGRHGRPPRWLPRPFGSSCGELLSSIGLPLRDPRPRLVATERARAELRERLARAGVDPAAPLCLVNAGGRPGSAKTVPPAIWAGAVRELRRSHELAVVVFAGPGEEAGAEQCGAALDGATVLARPALDLSQLVALCESARLVLSGDSGPRHLALAAGAKLVCVMGPTDPRHTADHLERTRVVRRVVPCGPCHLERCPIAGPEAHACLAGLDPERVAAAALELLRPLRPS